MLCVVFCAGLSLSLSLPLSLSLSRVPCTAILMKMLFLSTQYQVRTRYIFPTGIFRELCFVKWSLAFINQAKKLKMSPTHANTFLSIIVSKIFFYAFPLFYLGLIELPDTTHLFSQWIVKYFKIKVRFSFFFPILFPRYHTARKIENIEFLLILHEHVNCYAKLSWEVRQKMCILLKTKKNNSRGKTLTLKITETS